MAAPLDRISPPTSPRAAGAPEPPPTVPQEQRRVTRFFLTSGLRPEPDFDDFEEGDGIHAAALIASFTPGIIDNAEAAQQVLHQQTQQAITNYGQVNSGWAPGRTHDDNTRIICELWCTVSNAQGIHRNIKIHKTLGNGRNIKYEWSFNESRKGLAPFLVAVMAFGPKSRKEFYNEQNLRRIPMDETMRSCFALSNLVNICTNGDHQNLFKEEWMPYYDRHNMGSWYQTVIDKIEKHGVHSPGWVATRCNPGNINYCEGKEAIKWCKGVRYEIALVLRYIRPDCPMPPRDKQFMTMAEVTCLKHRHIVGSNGQPLPGLF